MHAYICEGDSLVAQSEHPPHVPHARIEQGNGEVPQVADHAQVIAAVATGALLTVATMLALRLYGTQRRADRERRIEAAVTNTVIGVETIRQQTRASPEHSTPETPDGFAEVRSRAHLHLLVSEEESHPQSACARPLPGAGRRRLRVRESRR